MHSSPDGRRLTVAALAAGAGALGVAAAWQGYAWPDTRIWVPDLLAGWTLSGLGLAAFALGYSRGAAVLLLASGVGWFIGDFHAVDPSWLGSLASRLSWLFLAPLVQLALAYPSGRPRTLPVLATTITVWFAAATPWVDWNDDTTLTVATAAAALVGLVELLRTPHRNIAAVSRGLAGLFLLLLWALVVPQLATSLQPVAFDGGVALVGVTLFAGLRTRPDLFERSIALDESTGTLREALAELLNDPALQLGLAIEQAVLVDELGCPVEEDVPGRRRTALGRGADAVVVFHDPDVLTTPEDQQAVTAAVTLAATRARLRLDLRRRADEISRSTARLIHAEDDERLRLAARLETRTTPALRDIARLVAEARAGAIGRPELEASLDRVDGQFDRAMRELEGLAAGLGIPALADGLRSALSELLAGLPLDAELHIADVDPPSELAATIWFVCAEALTNVLKHAHASRVLVEVAETRSGLHVVVEDNGRGGADATGTGLRGLRDRVAALGGTLEVESRSSGGTRLFAALPRPGVAR